MSAWRKISMKVPSDVISCAPGQPVGRIRNKGETARVFHRRGAAGAGSALDMSELR
jgi:hypothetical protein